ncbi:cbb3-type cytochrome c oxidase subunit I [Roseomonas sp. HF4]|uniref:cbb3-type cytochrome c oxidase subunit I n=1 Tax=Roseomonas sp. HF4 TaxID=2562313 RepID=UPI0010C107D5|nr:cbb3-type cytochrome c oxidase subunit I [Roseomonas sp. HF4]
MPADAPGREGPTPFARRILAAYIAVTALVLVLMMVLGVLMRLAQSEWLALDPALFYQSMTIHGVGMVGIAAVGGAAVMWYFLSHHVRLDARILLANLVLFLAGTVAILAAAFLGGFAGAWTFLFPLPASSGGAWESGAAATFLLGLLGIGVGFLLLFLDVARALIRDRGGLARALGWPQLFAGSIEPAPPPTVVASAMVTIVNIPALVAGAAIIVISLVNLIVPEFGVDALFAKNMTYFFGHTFVNATMYMTVIAVYEILPRHTGRPWKVNRVFLAAWTASTAMVLLVYPHHLMMDFVMPAWALAIGQVVSYLNGFPVLLVTGLGTLAIVHRSGIRWSATTTLMFIGMFGWMAGVIPAILDATIVVNRVMHNTMWVPGHFHFYMLLGLVPMLVAFMYHFTGLERGAPEGGAAPDRWAIGVFLFAGLGFVVTFLQSGRDGVPRRWAQHLPEWLLQDRIAAALSLLVLAAGAVMLLRVLRGALRGGAAWSAEA